MTPRQPPILAAVSLASFLGSVDGSVVNAALPILMRNLKSDFATTQWILLAYLLGLTVLQVGMGRLVTCSAKSRFSHWHLLLLVGSVVCGFSPTVSADVLSLCSVDRGGDDAVARFGDPHRDLAEPETRQGDRHHSWGDRPGHHGGPAPGGFLIERLNWRWIFFINLPVGALARCWL